MKYTITFYCPDRHIRYDAGRTPEKKGVGGGVNARIRLAQALARQGHNVTLICNCSRSELHFGVQYLPLEKIKQIDTDILILTSSGGDLSLEPALSLSITAKLKILLLHGMPKPKGVESIRPDYYYPPSNFIREVILKEWGGNIPENQIFVSHRGVTKKNYEGSIKKAESLFSFLFPVKERQPRDPFRLVYIGHPMKGRDEAIGVLNVLRKLDHRYHLYIFGDERLWGGKAQIPIAVEGTKNFGMVSQRRLVDELLQCSYGIFLQTRLEPYSNAMLEALSAGIVPLASAVGGFPEQVIHGWNGYLIDGQPNDPAIWEQSAHLIHDLNTHPEKFEAISGNAKRSTYDWDIVTHSWQEHWDMLLQPHTSTSPKLQPCPNCSQNATHFSDGYHCLHCGFFSSPQA
jgi:glycosyltransferase involved in cell wall biosynthesis